MKSVLMVLIVSLSYRGTLTQESVNLTYISMKEGQDGEIVQIKLKSGAVYKIWAGGASGGDLGDLSGGYGAAVEGMLEIEQGVISSLYIVVGKPGSKSTRASPGGGGGTFIFWKEGSKNSLVVAAGGGGGACVGSIGSNGSLTLNGNSAFEAPKDYTWFCAPKGNCIGKGGISGGYGSYPNIACKVNDNSLTNNCNSAGGLGLSWIADIPPVPAHISVPLSGKPGSNINVSTMFYGGDGGLADIKGGFGGFGGGGGGGPGKPTGGLGGSGAGGGYSGGGVGVGKMSCGGGGGTFCGLSQCKITQNLIKGGYAYIRNSDGKSTFVEQLHEIYPLLSNFKQE